METNTKTKWGIDPTHSEISFKVKHLMITNVKGVFKDFSAVIHTSADSYLTSDVDLTINPSSIDTGVADRDAHLRSADFFDVENFPEMSFKGTSIENAAAGSYILAGDMTIKGISKLIKLNIEFEGVMKDPWGNEKAGYTITGVLNRKDWGLNWNAALETGGFLVSDEVKLSCDVQLFKQS